MKENKSLKCGECNNFLQEIKDVYYLEYKGYVYPVKDAKQFVCLTCEYSIVDKEYVRIMKKTIDSYKERFNNA